MGKIKIKNIGDESLENEQKEIVKRKAYEKKLAKRSREEKPPAPAEPVKEEPVKPSESDKTVKVKTAKGKKKFEKKKSPRSLSYRKALENIDKSKKYKVAEALILLEKMKKSKFDETVELHVNTISTGTFGNVSLPHGTGKQIRVAIADDDLLAKVQQGKIDFDVLLAAPEMMPKLARVARILGPKGLMPNPKNATLVKDPKKAAEEFKKGQITLKTEAKSPMMHLIIGKMSFGNKKLTENFHALLEVISKDKILNVTLKSTMSPGIKLEL